MSTAAPPISAAFARPYSAALAARLAEAPRPPPRGAAEPLEVAGEVVPRDPALPGVVLPLDRVRAAYDRRVLRDRLHRPLPATHLRVQRRRDALDVARLVLLDDGARQRPLSAVLTRRAPGLSGDTRGRVSRAAVPVEAVREVAVRHSPARPRLHLRRRAGR